MLDVPVHALAFSPAGDLAVASGSDVHLVAGERIVELAFGDAVTCVAFRDARTLADGSRMTLVDSEARFSLQRFSPTCERIGAAIEIESATRIARLGDALVLAGEGTCIHDGPVLDNAEVSALAVHGDRLALGGPAGLRLIQR